MRFPVGSPFLPSCRRATVVPSPPEALRAACRHPGAAASTGGTSPVVLLLIVVTACVACGEDRSANEARTEPPPAWVTEAEYRFGDSPEEEVFFTAPVVRADPARGRIFAVDGRNHQVSVLALDGTLLFRVGRKGEGPGEFINMGSLRIEPDGAFAVQEARRGRYARFTAHGELVGTTPGPQSNALSYQGLPVDLHWPTGGSYLGTARIPNELEAGWGGLAPVTRMPVVRIRDLGNGRWSAPEPLLWMDISNRIHFKVLPGDGPGDTVWVTGSQPFGDPDFAQFEPGAVVVLRSKGDPGTVELIEVDAGGDTTWHRRVELAAPRRLTSAMVDEGAEMWVASMSGESRHPPARLHEAYFDGLYQPEYIPPSEGPPVLTASGEVWIRTPEVLDTLRVYCAVPRGDPDGLLRRVLLPASLWLTDATETHVWGTRWDSLGMPHIIGRRLVPPAG